MESNYKEEERYLRAQKRVKKIKGFYMHLFWYLIINIWLTLQMMNYELYTEDGVNEVLFHFGTYSTWFFWGIGVFFHGFHVFGKRLAFSKDWEERKIKEFMDKDPNND